MKKIKTTLLSIYVSTSLILGAASFYYYKNAGVSEEYTYSPKDYSIYLKKREFWNKISKYLFDDLDNKSVIEKVLLCIDPKPSKELNINVDVVNRNFSHVDAFTGFGKVLIFVVGKKGLSKRVIAHELLHALVYSDSKRKKKLFEKLKEIERTEGFNVIYSYYPKDMREKLVKKDLGIKKKFGEEAYYEEILARIFEIGLGEHYGMNFRGLEWKCVDKKDKSYTSQYYEFIENLKQTVTIEIIAVKKHSNPPSLYDPLVEEPSCSFSKKAITSKERPALIVALADYMTEKGLKDVKEIDVRDFVKFLVAYYPELYPASSCNELDAVSVTIQRQNPKNP